MRLIWVVGALAAAGCVTVQPRPPAIITDAETAEVKRAVLAELKDPGSAQFGVIRAVSDPSGDVGVCGRVNARNSFGGYAGPQPFIGTLRAGVFRVVAIESSSQAGTVELTCRQFGMPV